MQKEPKQMQLFNDNFFPPLQCKNVNKLLFVILVQFIKKYSANFKKCINLVKILETHINNNPLNLKKKMFLRTHGNPTSFYFRTTGLGSYGLLILYIMYTYS